MTGRFEADPGPFLRPYAMTEGRTEPTGPELAARVDLPLGVTRVLVGDLAASGVVTVHRAPSHTGGPNVALLEQVLHGLRRL